MTVKDSILHFNPDLKAEQLDTIEAAREVAQGLGIPLKDSYGLGKVQIEIFEKTVEHQLMQPTWQDAVITTRLSQTALNSSSVAVKSPMASRN